MKCLNCGNPNLAYTVFRAIKSKEKRTDFGAECKKCGWKGEINPKPFFVDLSNQLFGVNEKGKSFDIVKEMDKIERRESLEEGRSE